MENLRNRTNVKLVIKEKTKMYIKTKLYVAQII